MTKLTIEEKACKLMSTCVKGNGAQLVEVVENDQGTSNCHSFCIGVVCLLFRFF